MGILGTRVEKSKRMKETRILRHKQNTRVYDYYNNRSGVNQCSKSKTKDVG